MLTRRDFLASTAIGALALEAGLRLGRPAAAVGQGQATFTLTVNGATATVTAEAEMPLLWALREQLGLKGTKYGCGVGLCGICTVHLEGQPRRACVTPVGEAAGKRITTIEGLAADPASPLLRTWVAVQVPQCGYCQPGTIMTAAALLAEQPAPDDADIDRAMSGVLCRCGTYRRIRAAIHLAARGGAGPEVAMVEAGPPPADLPHALYQPNPWMRINADGTVTVIIDRAEMGQGVVTSLSTLVAEELEVDLAQVRTEFAPAERRYANPLLGAQVTGGSTSIRAAWLPLRQAAAAAREALVEAAASRWGVVPSACRAEGGQVVHDPTGRRLGYAAVAAAAKVPAAGRPVPLKPREQFRLIGKPLPRLDLPGHVTGRTVFGSDVTVPGMLMATVARGPAFGARVRRYDDSRARTVAGVKAVVAIDGGVAVVADRIWPALRGRDLLHIDWDLGPNARLAGADIERRFAEAAGRSGSRVRDEGDVEAALPRAETRIDADYFTPFLAHATMEPMNCTADARADRCDVWVGTQAQTTAQRVAADAAGLPAEAVRIHSTFLGGGFGRRLNQDYVREAVEISKAVGAPVQVVWTRRDDLRHDFYRPVNYTRLSGGLDRSGQVVAWTQRTVGPPLAQDGIDIPYAIDNLRTERVLEDPRIPTGPWRSVGASQNAFVVESFVDELAHAAGKDPLAFRLALLAKAPRHRRVLELAGERSGWGTPLPAGRHRGVAVYFSYGTWVAEVAEISVSARRRIRVHRVVAAIDCGTVVNPDTVAYQTEGAIVYGLTAALEGEITIRDGGVVEDGFDGYPLLTMAEMPEVEVHLVASDAPPGGVGEPGLPPIAPAVANALFAATGRRARRLPLRPA